MASDLLAEFPRPTGKNPRPVGIGWLLEKNSLYFPGLSELTFAADSAPSTIQVLNRTVRSIHSASAPKSLREHLRFAIRNEPVNLGPWRAILSTMGPEPILAWMADQPTSAYARKAWYLYELLTGDRLPITAQNLNFVPLLDPNTHVCSTGRDSQRHRISDNLLGDVTYCPLVRRSEKVKDIENFEVEPALHQLQQEVSLDQWRRSVAYLYTKESRSSFEIEGEPHQPSRVERFVRALLNLELYDISTKDGLLSLHEQIMDPRFVEREWRKGQTWIGVRQHRGGEVYHFVHPRPQDLASLVPGWFRCQNRCEGTHPLIAAGVVGFGFVYLHPFEDGNGRVHRYCIHHVLSTRGFTPKDVLIPISATMLKHPEDYDRALETLSKALMPLVDFRVNPDSTIEVTNATADLYRYWDATSQVEYLYECVRTTLDVEMREQLLFTRKWDLLWKGIRDIVDLPDRRLELLITLLLSSGGRLSKRKQPLYNDLTPDEVGAIETFMQGVLQDGAADG